MSLLDEELEIREICRREGRVYHAPAYGDVALPDAPLSGENWAEYREVILIKKPFGVVVHQHPYGKAFSKKFKNGLWQLRELVRAIDSWIATRELKKSQPKRYRGRPTNTPPERLAPQED